VSAIAILLHHIQSPCTAVLYDPLAGAFHSCCVVNWPTSVFQPVSSFMFLFVPRMSACACGKGLSCTAHRSTPKRRGAVPCWV
jgi:hypothetical protein